jgi:hypothetical protein
VSPGPGHAPHIPATRGSPGVAACFSPGANRPGREAVRLPRTRRSRSPSSSSAARDARDSVALPDGPAKGGRHFLHPLPMRPFSWLYGRRRMTDPAPLGHPQHLRRRPPFTAWSSHRQSSLQTDAASQLPCPYVARIRPKTNISGIGYSRILMDTYPIRIGRFFI